MRYLSDNSMSPRNRGFSGDRIIDPTEARMSVRLASMGVTGSMGRSPSNSMSNPSTPTGKKYDKNSPLLKG